MALELIGGAGLGAVFAMLYDVVKIKMEKGVNLRPLGALKSTPDSLQPLIIDQIEEHNVQLGLPNDLIESLKIQMEEGTRLVQRLSNLHILHLMFNCTSHHTEQLVTLDDRLKMLSESLKIQLARDMKETLLLARQSAKKLVEIEGYNREQLETLRLQVQQQEQPSALKERLALARESAKALKETKGSIRRLLATLELQLESEMDVETFGSVKNNIESALERAEKSSAVQAVASIVEGAALAAAFGELFDAVIEVKDKTAMFRLLLGDLDSTLYSLKPFIAKTVEYANVDCPYIEELENFKMQMEEGEKLVRKCSKVRLWSSYKKYKYTDQLVALDKSLQRLLGILEAVQGEN